MESARSARCKGEAVGACVLRILLLNQTFYPDVAATAQLLGDLAVALVEAGHEVTVVASRRGYDDAGNRFSAREVWRGVKIIRVGSTGFGKAAKWRRALDFGSFLAACGLRLAWLPRFDVVVALTSPPLISVFGAALARWRKSRFVYWVMDFNPDEAVAAGWLREGSLATRLLERLSRFSLTKAHRIVALDRFMADRIVAKGIPRAKISVVPPWSHDDQVRFDREGRERFRRTLGLEGKFVVMYSGNHSPCHPLETLVEAARRMVDDPALVFCFVGWGSEFRKLEAARAGGGLVNVVCLPYQPLAELAGSLSAADLHVVVMGDPFVGLVHPCKIYNILAVGAPILYVGPRPSHLTEILDGLRHPRFWTEAGHGQVERLMKSVAWARRQFGDRERGESCGAGEFGRERLVPRMVGEVERLQES